MQWVFGRGRQAALAEQNEKLIAHLEEVSVQNSVLWRKLQRYQSMLIEQAGQIFALQTVRGKTKRSASLPHRLPLPPALPVSAEAPASAFEPLSLTEHQLKLQGFAQLLKTQCKPVNEALTRALASLHKHPTLHLDDVD